MTLVASLGWTVLDCPDPYALARFYSEATGWPINPDASTEGWVELKPDESVTIAFQLASHHRPPVWPHEHSQQQIHPDFAVSDFDEGERRMLDLGAVKAETQPMPDRVRVFFNPAGHPFCLTRGAQSPDQENS